jgi:hypothetical protein
MSRGGKLGRAVKARLSLAVLVSVLTCVGVSQAAPAKVASVAGVPPDVLGLCDSILKQEAEINAEWGPDLATTFSGASCLNQRLAVVKFCSDPSNAAPVSGSEIVETLNSMTVTPQEHRTRSAAARQATEAFTKEQAKAAPDPTIVAALRQAVQSATQKVNNFDRNKSFCTAPPGMRIAGGVDAIALQDTLIRGLAAFVAARLKGELSLALEKRLLTELCKDAEGKKVFEASCTLLEGRSEQGSQKIQAWGTLKAAFESDLQQLPDRAVALVLSDQRIGGAAGPMARELGSLAVAVLEAAAKGQDVVQLLKSRTAIPTQNCDASVQAGCFQFMLGAAAQALSSDLGHDFSAPGSFEAYARVVLKGLMMAGGANAGNLLDPNELTVRIEALRQLRAQLELLAAVARRTDQGPERVSAYLTAIAPLFKQAAILWQGAVLSNNPSCSALTADCLVWIGDRLERMAKLFDDVQSRNYQAAWVDALALAQDFGVYDKLPSWVSAYGSFAVQLASAKTSDEAQQALESAALPLGSYENKRVAGNFAMTVTALPGIRYGREWIQSSDVKADPSAASHAGMFAPLGVDMTIGLCDKWSLGLMLSAIDLGNLVDYRLEEKKDVPTSDDMEKVDVETEPKVGFAQIVSPGAYLTLGLYDLPLVVGGGVALAPGLRTVESNTTGEKSNASVLQASVFLAVDVSIFALLN